MKITPNTYNPTLTERANQKPAPSSDQSSSSSTPSSSAVALSSTARHLQHVQSAENDIDMERVQALRSAIADGTLEVSADRIADGLLGSARELLK